MTNLISKWEDDRSESTRVTSLVWYTIRYGDAEACRLQEDSIFAEIWGKIFLNSFNYADWRRGQTLNLLACDTSRNPPVIPSRGAWQPKVCPTQGALL